MTHSLSVVLLIPETHKSSLNTLAESFGWGKDNMSIKLACTDGSTWYGCHTWAHPNFLNRFDEVTGDYNEVLQAMVMSVREGGDPYAHWSEKIAEYNLSIPEPPEEDI